MKLSTLPLSILAALAIAAPAAAQSPKPHPSVNLINPNARHTTQHKMTGRGCTSGVMANRAQTTVNPINGKAQAAPVVVVPLTKNGGSVANATSRAQQAQACAHPTH